jgi:DNA-binding transcriptional LysR family regulator
MNLNLLQLRYFHAVALEGSFTRAALKLRIAQPALSKMVRQLEESVGKPLLIRSRRGLELTAHGKLAFERSQKIFSEAAELERSLSDVPISRVAPLRIGTNDLLATRALPAALAGLDLSGLGIYPVVQVGSSQSLCDQLLSRRLDLALLFHVPEVPEKLRVEALRSFRFRLVGKKARGGADAFLDCFIGSREVDETGARSFPTLAKWRKVRPRAEIRISSNSLLAHLALVHAGQGISVLPDFLVREDLRNGSLVDLLPTEALAYPLKLLKLRDFPPGAEASKLLEALEPVFKGLESGHR